VIRLPTVILAFGCTVLLAGCGGSGSSGSAAPATTAGATTSTAPAKSPPAGTMQALWQKLGGEPVGMVAGTTDYGVGTNRVSFLVVDSKSQLIETPTARVWVSHGLEQKPFAETTAKLVPIGVPGGAKADAQNIYVARVDTTKPGKYWILAQPLGGTAIQALGEMVVRRHSATPAVGDRAIPSKNPTVGPGVTARSISTARPPDTALLRTTVAAAMAAKRPFVVSFATPQFCQSRTCGPVVQVVQSVARQRKGSGVDFIHIEIYKDNDPAKGTNQWVNQWNLQSEPFTFVVDRNGIIRDRFEGAFSAGELQAAVQKVAG
jgi:hypothetical protein